MLIYVIVNEMCPTVQIKIKNKTGVIFTVTVNCMALAIDKSYYSGIVMHS